jgi:hypothetical protein
MQKTISYPLWKKGSVEEKVAYFQKRSKKLGISEPVVEWLGTTWFYDLYSPNGARIGSVEMGELTISYEPIKAAGGWQFAALIEKTEAGNLLSGPLSGQLGHYREHRAFTCDHCNTARNRKKHYVLTNQEGQTKMVGSNCIKDFLGHDPAGAIESMHILDWIENPAEDDWDSAPGGDWLAADFLEVAAMTMAFVRRIGFKSAKQCTDWEMPTWMQVSDQLFRGHKMKSEDRVVPNEQELELANQALARWLTVSESIRGNLANADEWDYRRHLFAVNRLITPQPRQMAIAVGMLANEYKAIAREKEAPGVSEFFGAVNQRDTFDLKVLSVRIIQGEFGDTQMISGVQVINHDATSNKWVWFNKGQRLEVCEGVHIKAKATVTKHNEDPRWGKQTQLSRLKLL